MKFDRAADATMQYADVAPRHWRLGLLLMFATALALRLYAVTQYPTLPHTDGIEYQYIATQLAAGKGYITYNGHLTATRTPGYPGFLALIYAVAGSPNFSIAYIMQAVVGSATVVLLAALGSMILRRREALVAGMLAAIYPSFFWLPRQLLSENIVLPFLLATLCATALWMRGGRWGWMIVAGLSLGIATLMRGSTVLVAVFLAGGLVLWLRRQPLTRGVGIKRYAPVLGLLLGAFVVVAPWCGRNYATFGRFALATEEGVAWYFSYWPPVRDGKRIWGDVNFVKDPSVMRLLKQSGGDEVRFSDLLRRETFTRLAHQPSYFFRLIPTKITFLLVPLDWEILPHRSDQQRSINWVYALLMLPALPGAWLLRRRREPLAWLLWVLPLAVLLQTVLFYGGPRFRLPADTTLLLCAAIGLVGLWDAVARRTSSQPLATQTAPT